MSVRLRADGSRGCQRGLSMVQLRAFLRLLRVSSLRAVTLALCSVAIVASASPASARSHHGAGRYAHARHYSRHASRHIGRHFASRHYRHIARTSRWERGIAQMQARGFADTHASLSSGAVSGCDVGRLRFFECRCRGAPLSRRQSHRSGKPVVRAVHEHGFAAFRLSRHRLGHGEFICPLRPAGHPVRRSARLP